MNFQIENVKGKLSDLENILKTSKTEMIFKKEAQPDNQIFVE